MKTTKAARAVANQPRNRRDLAYATSHVALKHGAKGFGVSRSCLAAPASPELNRRFPTRIPYLKSGAFEVAQHSLHLIFIIDTTTIAPRTKQTNCPAQNNDVLRAHDNARRLYNTLQIEFTGTRKPPDDKTCTRNLKQINEVCHFFFAKNLHLFRRDFPETVLKT